MERMYQGAHQRFSFPQEFEDTLALSLSPPSTHTPPPPPPPPLPHPLYLSRLTGDRSTYPTAIVTNQESAPSRTSRPRRNPTQAPRAGKSETIPASFPWATTFRATVHSLNHLFSIGIRTISGEVQCKRCERIYEMEHDLQSKFIEVASFIAEKKSKMHDRAPQEWVNPILPTCIYCNQVNSVKPIISLKKRSINWLFLLLGQMLGCCTLDQLKYFCKHTKNHRTGAKDRVLYLTYLGLCKQLDDTELFDR